VNRAWQSNEDGWWWGTVSRRPRSDGQSIQDVTSAGQRLWRIEQAASLLALRIAPASRLGGLHRLAPHRAGAGGPRAVGRRLGAEPWLSHAAGLSRSDKMTKLAPTPSGYRTHSVINGCAPRNDVGRRYAL